MEEDNQFSKKEGYNQTEIEDSQHDTLKILDGPEIISYSSESEEKISHISPESDTFLPNEYHISPPLSVEVFHYSKESESSDDNMPFSQGDNLNYDPSEFICSSSSMIYYYLVHN